MLYDNMKGLQLSFLLGDYHSKEENKEVQSKMTSLIQQKNDVRMNKVQILVFTGYASFSHVQWIWQSGDVFIIFWISPN